MDIHIRLDGDIIDLLALPDDEYGFYSQCLTAYRNNMAYGEYLKMVQDPGNPMMKGNVAMTKGIYESPLCRAVWDLGYRLAIKQGEMAPEGDFVDIDPAQPETFVNASEAGERIGMTKAGVIAAVKSGRIAGHQKGSRWNISVRSLDQYKPHRARQEARLGK